MAATAAARKRPQGLRAEDDFPEIISLRSRPAGERDEQRKPVFEIDGTVYTIATKPIVSTAMKYAHMARTVGRDEAVDFMLEALLGEEGYTALREFDDLTENDLERVITIASKIMAGATERPKGKR